MPEEAPATRIQMLEEVVGRDPSTAMYLPLAEGLREQGRVEEAIHLCEERKNRPGHGVGDHIVLGRCYLADGRLGEARAEFEGALALDRENVVALKALAGILAHEGGHPSAVDFYRAVCRVDPGDLESQTALNQITSGEFADVCPADVVVGQGEGWQPVRLPREEDHLSDLALGLRTIEDFDPAKPDPDRRRSRDFQEFSLDELEQGTAALAPVPSRDPETGTLERLDPEAPASTEVLSKTPEAPARTRPSEPPAPTREPAPFVPKVTGNRSAFESWLHRMGGGS